MSITRKAMMNNFIDSRGSAQTTQTQRVRIRISPFKTRLNSDQSFTREQSVDNLSNSSSRQLNQTLKFPRGRVNNSFDGGRQFEQTKNPLQLRQRIKSTDQPQQAQSRQHSQTDLSQERNTFYYRPSAKKLDSVPTTSAFHKLLESRPTETRQKNIYNRQVMMKAKINQMTNILKPTTWQKVQRPNPNWILDWTDSDSDRKESPQSIQDEQKNQRLQFLEKMMMDNGFNQGSTKKSSISMRSNNQLEITSKIMPINKDIERFQDMPIQSGDSDDYDNSFDGKEKTETRLATDQKENESITKKTLKTESDLIELSNQLTPRQLKGSEILNKLNKGLLMERMAIRIQRWYHQMAAKSRKKTSIETATNYQQYHEQAIIMLQRNFKRIIQFKRFARERRKSRNEVVKVIIQPKFFENRVAIDKPIQNSYYVYPEWKMLEFSLIASNKLLAKFKSKDYRFNIQQSSQVMLDKLALYDPYNEVAHPNHTQELLLEQLSSNAQMLDYQSQTASRTSLRNIFSQFPQLLYIENGQIQFYGITDICVIFKDQISKHIVSKSIQERVINKESVIIDLQSKARVILAKQQAHIARLNFHKKQQAKEVHKTSFIVKMDNYVMVKIFEQKNQKLVKCIDMTSKAISNIVQLPPKVEKCYGELMRDNFLEMFQLANGKLNFSEEVIWMLKKDQKIGNSSIKRMNDAVSKLQRYYKKRQLREAINYRIKARKIMAERYSRKATHHCLGRKVLKTCLRNKQTISLMMIASLTIRESDRPNYSSNQTQSDDPRNPVFNINARLEQIVTIKAYPIDHTGVRLQIRPFQQLLFENMEISDLAPISKIMLDDSHIKYDKHQLPFVVTRNTEEIEGQIMSGWARNANFHRKDPSLDGRRVINRKMFRTTWIRGNQSCLTFIAPIIEAFEVHRDPKKSKKKAQSKQQFHIYTIVRLYIGLQRYRRARTSLASDVIPYNHDSIQRFVLGFRQQSAFGSIDDLFTPAEPKTSVMDTEPAHVDKFQQFASQRGPFTELSNLKIEVDTVIVLIRVCVFPQSNELVVSWNVFESKQMLLIIPLLDVIGTEISLKLLQKYLNELLYSQLSFNQKQDLLFQPKFEEDLAKTYRQIIEQEELERIQLQKAIRAKKNYFQILTEETQGDRTEVKLQSLGVQPILLFQDNHYFETVESEWHLTLPMCEIIVTFYNTYNTNRRVVHRILPKDLECPYIFQVLKGSSETMIKFFTGPIKMLSDMVDINERLESNWPSLNFKTTLLSFFASKINRMVKKTYIYHTFKTAIMCRTSRIIIKSCYEQAYKSFFRITYLYHTYQQTIGVYLWNINSKKTRCYEIDLFNLEGLYGQNHFSKPSCYLHHSLFMKTLSAKKNHLIHYYRGLLTLMVDILHSKLQITSDMRIYFQGLGSLPIKQVNTRRVTTEKDQENEMSIEGIFMVTKVQAMLRKMRKQEWFILVQKKRKMLQNRQKIDGKLVRRKFIRLSDISDIQSNEIFILYMYSSYAKDQDSTLDESNLERLLIELYPYKHVQSKEVSIKGQFMHDHRKELLSGELHFYDFIISSLRLENGLLIINKSMEKRQYVPHEKLEDISPTKTKRMTVRPILNKQSTLFDTTQLNQVEKSTKLIHHITKMESDGQHYLYNVLYSGDKPMAQQEHDNIMQIEINLAQLKILYPNIDPNDRNLMRNLGEQLIQGLRIENGELMVNKELIKPKLCKVKNNSISRIPPEGLINKEPELKSQQAIKHVLLKKTFIYAKIKYLITISFDEMPVHSLYQKDNDELFQHFQMYYRVCATALNAQQELNWMITPDELGQVTKQRSSKDLAIYIIKRLLIVQDRLLFIVKRKEDASVFRDTKQVIFFYQKALVPIQRRIRNRKFMQNYMLFREQMKYWRNSEGCLTNNVYLYTSSKLRGFIPFIVLAGEDLQRRLVIICWSLITYKQYQLEVQKRFFVKFLLDSRKKKMLMIILANEMVYFDEQTDSINLNQINQEDMLMALQERFKTSESRQNTSNSFR